MGSEPPNLMILEKKAVKAALENNWKDAVGINSEILETYPNHLNAKIRLGKAYLELKDFPIAKKYFYEVLKQDPINKVAAKNLKLAKERKTKNSTSTAIKDLIIEPGTSLEITMINEAQNIPIEDFTPAEKLWIKLNKKSANIYKLSASSRKKNIFIGKVNSEIANKLNSAKAKKFSISAHFISGNREKIKILFKSNMPIFKSEKQEIKPYMKHITLEIQEE